MMSSQNTNRGSARTHGELTVCDNWAAQNICLHNKCKVHSTSVFFLFYISPLALWVFFRCTKIQHATWKKFSTRLQTFGLSLMWRRDSILQCITWQYMCVTSHKSAVKQRKVFCTRKTLLSSCLLMWKSHSDNHDVFFIPWRYLVAALLLLLLLLSCFVFCYCSTQLLKPKSKS